MIILYLNIYVSTISRYGCNFRDTWGYLYAITDFLQKCNILRSRYVADKGKNISWWLYKIYYLRIFWIKRNSLWVSFLPSPKRNTFLGLRIFRKRVLHLSDHIVKYILKHFFCFSHTFYKVLWLDKVINYFYMIKTLL